MSNLVVLGFENEPAAMVVVEKLHTMAKDKAIKLTDVALVNLDEDGKPHIKQDMPKIGSSSMKGAIVGGIIGAIFFVPVAGAVIGAGAGAVAGGFKDHGIDDGFAREVARSIKPGETALFVLADKADTERLAKELEGTKATIINSSLSFEKELELRNMLEDE